MRLTLSLLAVSAALLLPCAYRMHAQELALPAPADAHLTFDIATIRPVKEVKPDESCYVHSMPTGEGYTAHCISVKLIMSILYKIPARQIIGGPEWLDTQRFDIEAKTDKPRNLDELHAMFQNLLADRFGLKFHVETKPGNIYALTIDKSGLKMVLNTDPDDFQIPTIVDYNGIHGKRVPMNYLCWQLGQILEQDERPVINMTGLTGNYNYNLDFAPTLPAGYNKDSLPPGYLDKPNIHDALRQQMGLKLVPQKGPVTYIAIDHIEMPSEN